MVQSGPRFGGGKIMEQRYITHNYTMPNKMEKGILGTNSVEPCLDYQVTMQARSPRHYDDGDDNKTESWDSVVKQCIQDIEHNPDGNNLNEEDSGPTTKVSSSNKREDEAEEPTRRVKQYKEDVEQLLSILRTLDINVKVKKYNRTNISSQEIAAANPHPIDLTYVSTIGRKPSADRFTVKQEYSKNDVIYCKNLFLKDRKGKYYLVIADEDAVVDFKLLKQQLKATRNLSFADAMTTNKILGLKSGEINPFVAMRESANDVKFIMHHSLKEAQNSKRLLAFHPFDGCLQVDITIDELITFLNYHDKHLEFLSPYNNITEKDSQKNPVHNEHNSISHEEVESRQNDKTNDQKKSDNADFVDAKAQCGSIMQDDHNDEDRKDYAEHVGENVEGNVINSETFTDQGVGEEGVLIEDEQKDIDGSDTNISQDTSSTKTKSHIFTPSNRNRANVKPLWKIYGRKGKLKSFLKRNAHASDFSTSKPLILHKLSEEVSGNDSEIKAEEHDEFSKPQAESISEQNSSTGEKEECLNIPDGENYQILSEITQFYSKLADLHIKYREINLRLCTTKDIGTSLGCKCFLLKDKGRKYFLVITHEYYELDHGRLKKALKPRKKLNEVEAADILDNLGVQPLRITPFSCTTDRAKSRNIMVFITEKIRPPEIILCIQHPYANGCRLIMSSGELQRYLSIFTSNIGTVEEKVWPAKYNGIFSSLRLKT